LDEKNSDVEETEELADNLVDIDDLVEETQDDLELKQDEASKSTESKSGVDVTALEGDLIDLEPLVVDPDGDVIELGFTLPFDGEGKWQTEVGDAGFYSIIVTATDGKGNSFVTDQLTIQVNRKNSPPLIDLPDVLTFEEGDLIVLEPVTADPDGDKVTLTISGWMDSRTYQTTYDDAGTYEVKLRADDGENLVYKLVKIEISDVNREPLLSLNFDSKIEVTEGDLIELDVLAEDPDGDSLSLMYGEPFDEEGKWQTSDGDAGLYESYVSATDTKAEVTESFTVNVLKKNVPPVIESLSFEPGEIVLKKPGDSVTVKLNVAASDSDGDELEITYSGFMTSAEKTVYYGEKGGLMTVTVTVSDGKDSVSEDISIEMNNWPCFNCG